MQANFLPKNSPIRLSRIAVKRALLDAGISQRTICLILKISESNFSLIAGGHRSIPKKSDILAKLSKVLRVAPEILLDSEASHVD